MHKGAAGTGQPGLRHRLAPAWLLSQAGGSAEPAEATDAKRRQGGRAGTGGDGTEAIVP